MEHSDKSCIELTAADAVEALDLIAAVHQFRNANAADDRLKNNRDDYSERRRQLEQLGPDSTVQVLGQSASLGLAHYHRFAVEHGLYQN